MNKIIYLDAAATALKPQSVISAESDFLQNKYANAGRGICPRAAAVDSMVSAARGHVAKFIGARDDNIVFTSGATDALNRVVNIIMRSRKNRPMRIAVSDLDHHSARMPWMVAAGTEIIVIPLNENFDIDISQIPAADVIVITAMSNVFGRPQNVGDIIRAARKKNPNVISIVDAAQYIAHLPINIGDWDCDFMCFSGHKIGSDTGIGVMYIKNPGDFSPDKFGGGMVNKITDNNELIYNIAPERFEAGTLPLTQIAGLPHAIDACRSWNCGGELIGHLYNQMLKIPRVNLLSAPGASLITFTIDNMHVLDFGAIMGAHNVCLRVGNMCATWAHRALGVSGSARISAGPWNTIDEMNTVADIIKDVVK